ncbi:MAG: aldose 1-epimerase family protein [Planctomycetota bacterium]
MRPFLRTCVLLTALLGKPTVGAEPLRYVLLNTAGNVRATDFSLSSDDVPGSGGPWSIRSETLHGGTQEGVELVTIDTGRLVIRVIPTRGMSVLDVRRGDFRLGWDSPVKEIVHPHHVDLESRGGLGWLQGFNEWMVRCGLEFAGHPGLDEFTDNTGAKATMPLSLHGRIGNLPASRVEVLVDREAPHRLRLRGIVHERWFNGPKLELATELSVVPGGDVVRIEDAVTNHGGTPQEFQLIYHANFGRPLLEEGARVVAAIERIAPMNAHAAKAIAAYETYAGPVSGFIEEVYLAWPYADASGRSTVMLQNAAGDRGATIRWAIAECPYLGIWKNTAAEADGYVTGIEPMTNFPYNRRIERQAGRVPKLAAGETRRFTLEFGLHDGREAVEAQAAAIAAIRAGRPTAIVTAPPVPSP